MQSPRRFFALLFVALVVGSLAIITSLDATAQTAHKVASSCFSPPPKPMDQYWDIQKCWWENNRPSGYNHVAPWIAAATEKGVISPNPTVEIDWINVYGKNSSGQTVTLYSTASGSHGLNRNGQWQYRTLTPSSECLYNGQPSYCWGNKYVSASNMIGTGDIAKITLSRYPNYDVAHLWNAGSHIAVPTGMTDVWAEARVRSTGDGRFQIGLDWWNDGVSPQVNKEASLTPFVSGLTCNNDWVLISTPRKNTSNCDPLVNNSATPQTPGATTPPPPAPNPTTPPAPPSLSSPAAGASFTTGSNVNFSWGTVNGAKRYMLAICSTSNLGNPCLIREPGNGATSYSVPASDIGTGTKYWAVRSIGTNESLGWGNYSTSRNLIINTPTTNQWTFNFTLNTSATPSNVEIYRQSTWTSLPVTVVNAANKQYRATAPSSGFSTNDKVTIMWKENGTQRWGCELVNASTGQMRISSSLTATGPTGLNYSGYGSIQGNGCNLGIR